MLKILIGKVMPMMKQIHLKNMRMLNIVTSEQELKILIRKLEPFIKGIVFLAFNKLNVLYFECFILFFIIVDSIFPA